MLPKWSDDLLTGNNAIDFQHKEIFRRMGLFFEACRQGNGQHSLQEVFLFLGNHVKEHFGDEELLQTQSSFPEFPEHKKSHDAFLERINQFKLRFEIEGSSFRFMNDVLMEINNWLRKHILETDKKFSKFLKEKQAEPVLK